MRKLWVVLTMLLLAACVPPPVGAPVYTVERPTWRAPWTFGVR